MRGVVMYKAGDVRVQEREDPRIVEPTDAIVRLTVTCICGSDLWPYRGVEPSGRRISTRIGLLPLIDPQEEAQACHASP